MKGYKDCEFCEGWGLLQDPEGGLENCIVKPDTKDKPVRDEIDLDKLKNSLYSKEKFDDLNPLEIEYLQMELKELGIGGDVIFRDRLGLIRCIMVCARNRDDWQKNAELLGYDYDKHGWAGNLKTPGGNE